MCRHGKRDVAIKPIGNRLGLNVQEKLQVFKTDGLFYECNEVERSSNSSSSFSPSFNTDTRSESTQGKTSQI